MNHFQKSQDTSININHRYPCKNKRVLYDEVKKNVRIQYKNYCKILNTVINQAKKIQIKYS
jgi:hypothetical protein